MVDEVIDGSTAPDGLRVKRDEILKNIKPAEAPKLTEPDVYEGLIKKESEATLGAAKKKAELEVARADRESRTARDLSQKYESQYKDIPEFKATPESKAELVGLFGLIGAIGAFGGGKSYGSALGAMNAMGGMLKGYREGRKDLFEREKAEFDKNMQSIKAHNDQITAAFNRAKELAKSNLPAAERKLFTDLKSLEADALATNLYKKGLMETDKMRIEVMNRANTQTEQALKTVASIDKTLGTGAKRTFVTVNNEQKYLTDEEIVAEQNKGNKVAPAAKSGRSYLATQFEDMTTIAVNEAALNIATLVNAPFATTGFFQGRNTGNLTDAPIGVLANKLTSQSVQQYNTMMGNIGTYITKILYGGRVVPAGVQKSFTDRYSIREGDKPFTVLTKLADLRQTFDRAIEVKMKSSMTTDEMKEIYKEAKDEIESAIPFTMNDVNRVQQETASAKGQKLKTFGDFMTEKMGSKDRKDQGAATTQAPKATLNGRAIIVRDGRWVYEDSGEPAQ
jgi:hypothetical protein